MRLYLVRHGQTEDNRQRRYCGARDTPLNFQGRRQAIALCRSGVLPRPDVVFSSPLCRSRQTAAIVLPEHQSVIAPELAELRFGCWEGLCWEEIMAQDAAAYAAWLADPVRCAPPDGETVAGLSQRTGDFLRRLRAQYANKTVVCFTHAGVIQTAVCLLLGKELNAVWSVPVEAASVSFFYVEAAVVCDYYLNRRAGAPS
ncbi:MAG: histidine phosphatase family protein [Candidatus Omnitrophica bacterium]|nr:histidine phosphatase family protein [Candidatus Omnitrophota bacterium]